MLAAEKQKAILDFLPRLQAQVDADYAKFMPAHKDWAPVLSYKEGQRFVKIHASDKRDGVVDLSGGRVFGFIEKETGLLWKAATYKAPALNFSRGSINDADISKIRWTGIS